MKEQKVNFNPKLFKAERGKHRNKNVIWLHFEFDYKIKEHLKKHTTAKFSSTHKSWYVPDNKHYRQLFDQHSKILSEKNLAEVHPVNQVALERYINQLQLKGYSENTLRIYSSGFIQLLKTLKDFPVNDLKPERLRSYFLYCAKKQKFSESAINSRINAIKFYFEQVLHRERMFFDIPGRKSPVNFRKSFPKKKSAKCFGLSKI